MAVGKKESKDEFFNEFSIVSGFENLVSFINSSLSNKNMNSIKFKILKLNKWTLKRTGYSKGWEESRKQ